MRELQVIAKAGIVSKVDDMVTLTPDTSRWSGYYIVIMGSFETILIGKPTMRANWCASIL
jgi:hypothetical protein